MPTQDAPPPDRHLGMIAYGCVVLALGGALALAAAAIIWRLPHRAVGVPATVRTAALYAAEGLFFACAGIGSIKRRRWARALLLAMSSLWLIVGIGMTLGLALVLPMVLQMWHDGAMHLPEAMFAPVMITTLVISGFLTVIVPGIGVLIYRSKRAKAVVERAEPTRSVIERLPLPLLFLGYASFTYLVITYSLPLLPLLGLGRGRS